MDIIQAVLESTRPKHDQFLTITGSFLWISDFEIPYHDADFINKLFTLTSKLNIKKAVWGGDALHMDSFSPFQPELSPDEEVSQVDQYLPGFLEPFDEIYWFVGNHDQRLQARLRDLGLNVSACNTLRMMLSPDIVDEFNTKVRLSEYRYMKAGTDWLLEHPKNTSTIPGRVAQQLSSKFHCHTLVGHTHLQSKSMFNGFWTIETGCCVDIERLRYGQMMHNTRAQMTQGAVLMLEQSSQYIPIDLSPKNIEFYLRLLNPLSKDAGVSIPKGRKVPTPPKKS